MSKQQQQLNGAYYGPAIPPPDSYHSHGRSRGCGCCSCIFGLIFKILVTVIVVVGIIALVFWLVYRPNRVRFHVTDADLTQFDLNSTTLHYNLSMNLNIRNPNKHIGIYYDRIEARAYYHDQRFATKQLIKFYQGYKNTTDLSLALNGQNIVVLENSKLSDFNSEKSKGVYEIELKLHLRIRFRLRGIKTNKFKPKLECDLKVPLNADGKTSASFETTKCGIDW